MVVSDDGDLLEEGIIVTAPTRTRRTVTMPAPRETELSREAEIAYIRSDMRRLFVIAGGLLALMLVLLVVVSP